MDYLNAIKHARSPEKAALYVRALAALHAGTLVLSSNNERLAMVEQAEQLAQQLERPYDGPKPWRKWLKEAGY